MSAPTTPAQMFDLLHAWFGIGTSDEEAGASQPWYRERIVEIAKLKRLMKSRRATLTEVYRAAQYARRNNRPVHATWQVFALIPEAMREHFRVASEAKRAVEKQRLADVVAEALEAGEPGWADRLMRATDTEKAIAEWRNR